MVDDASEDGEALRAEAEAAGARYLRRERAGRRGRGAQRRPRRRRATSSSRASTRDCVPRPGWLDALLPHFADPEVSAVAPRIVALDEAARSARGEWRAALAASERAAPLARALARYEAGARRSTAGPRRARHPVRAGAVRARRGDRRPPAPALRRDAPRWGGRGVRVAGAVRALRAGERRSRTTTAPTRARGSRRRVYYGRTAAGDREAPPRQGAAAERLAVDDRRVGSRSPRAGRSPPLGDHRGRDRAARARAQDDVPDPIPTAVRLAALGTPAIRPRRRRRADPPLVAALRARRDRRPAARGSRSPPRSLADPLQAPRRPRLRLRAVARAASPSARWTRCSPPAPGGSDAVGSRSHTPCSSLVDTS